MQLTHKKIKNISSQKEFTVLEEKKAVRNFLQVLNFREEGLAAAQDEKGWFHIDLNGNDVYEKRYQRTFGYYFARAAVIEKNLWFHIDTKGNRIYDENYAFCGNYQQSVCVVRDLSQKYYHIDLLGKPIYAQKYTYVGDYKDDFACVRLENGFYKHINKIGEDLNEKLFLDLGVFHKSFATARDEKGWFHIDKQGNGLYEQRFLTVEPFYNGCALVENFEREKLIISELGEIILSI